ncbi:MAG: GNAT family N-acetyltransferase [Bacteroidales bacterium]
MITIKALSSNKELRAFVQFKIDLYADNPYAVPPLFTDELNTLTPTKNPASEFCSSQCFLAFKDGEIVGRICAIINERSNEAMNKKQVRFGFIDFIDDREVSKALINAVEEWGRERGMDTIHGPLGFTDMDQEGMLIEGFDQLGTMATLYNHPYYPQHIEEMGFTKDVDWKEFKIYIPDSVPEKYSRVAEIVKRKYNLRVLKFTSASQVVKQGWGKKLFELVNASYKDLYGFTSLTKRQIDHYIKMYVPILRMDMLTLIVDEHDELICFGVALPSLSKALQKSKGKLFPFGFIHFLKALKGKPEVVDLMLLAARPDYQNKGVTALLFADLIESFKAAGTIYAESNPELESNERVQAQWDAFHTEHHKVRRAYSKSIL